MTAERERMLDLGPEPARLTTWVGSLWSHRDVLRSLAAKDFKVRYKRASFGIAWAILLPLVQAAVLIVVFGRLGLDDPGLDYLGYVLSGVTAWSYASVTFTTATSSVVDGASLTDKVWFPRALLALAPASANLVGLGIGVLLVVSIQAVRGELDADVLLVVPAVLLLVSLVVALSLVSSALYVRFRDVRFIAQALTLLLFYATPILYTPERLGRLADALPFNPFAGAIGLFQRAFVDEPVQGWHLIGTGAWTVALLALGVELHRRNDRTFVDLL